MAHNHITSDGCFFLQNFDAEISAVVAENVWDTPERQKYLSETIVEHLYRQGMLSVAEDLCQVSYCKHRWCFFFSMFEVKMNQCSFSFIGVWCSHRYEYEAAISGTEQNS